ncbi:MAG: 5'-3' exonuclease H3TH domain-containing protein [Verrucomicrobiota bacterium]
MIFLEPCLGKQGSMMSLHRGSISMVQTGATLHPRFLLVDGHAYAYRAFYAIRQLNSPSGQATNAIYGFIKMLAKMQAQLQPTHLMILWDGGLAEERMTLLPEYKAQRPEMPSDLERQLDEIMEYLRAASITSWCEEGVEADDFIATIAKKSVDAGLPVVIASADKDFMQLVSEHVSLLNPNDKTELLWTAANVRAKAGVEPEQIVDWLSLVGDSVDNISGVTGVGPKTASDLMKQFGSLEELYRRLPEVKSERLRTNLATAREIVLRNQKLIRLRDDLPCDFELEKFSTKPAANEDLRRLFTGWGFKTLLHDLEKAQVKQSNLFGD